MKVYRSVVDFQRGNNPVATIGTFDGVHLGHASILNRLIESAKSQDGESVVISFHPHPRLVLFPEDNPMRLLHTVDEKIERMEKLGIDKFLIIPFTLEFSRLTSEDFIRDILVEAVGIKKIIVGYDHHFGRNRTGGLKELEKGSEEWGFEVEEIPAQQVNDANVSSTKIRQALLSGNISLADQFLGYPYPYSGLVVKGDSLGRKLGFPTANLNGIEAIKLIPADGVYLVGLTLPGESNYRYGLASIGHRPTVAGKKRVVEVHILDYEGDLYDKNLKIEFLAFIRNQEKFDGLEALVAQMKLDEVFARNLIPGLTHG